jgi:hypothetical protein
MSNPIYFAPYQTPFVDLKTGIISREWYLFLQQMFNRIGGSTAPPTPDDILQGVPNELGAAELLALQSSAADAAGQVPVMLPATMFDDLLGELRQARDQVAELMKQIDGLQQGTVCL